ncbi:hypothetical protein H0H93_005282, partial [Arthromyces matolae]
MYALDRPQAVTCLLLLLQLIPGPGHSPFLSGAQPIPEQESTSAVRSVASTVHNGHTDVDQLFGRNLLGMVLGSSSSSPAQHPHNAAAGTTGILGKVMSAVTSGAGAVPNPVVK